MEVNNSSSLAVAAYAIQQQQQVATRTREGERVNETMESGRAAASGRGDNVSFSSEALRLSNPSSPDTSRTVVNQASDTTGNRQVRPEVARAESAATAEQALNAYRSTAVY